MIKNISISTQILKDVRTGREWKVWAVHYPMPDGGMQCQQIEDKEKFLEKVSQIMERIEPTVLRGIT